MFTLKLFKTDGLPRDRSLINERRVHGAWNFLVDPWRSARDTPAIWRADINPSVVIMTAPQHDIAPLAQITQAHVILADHKTCAGRHFVLGIDQRRHRMLISGPSLSLNYVLPADATLAVRFAATSAFDASRIGGAAQCFQGRVSPSRYQRHRLALLLAMLDHLDRPGEAPPTLRELAREVVFPRLSIGSAIEWKASSHRRQVQRLVLDARRMASVGFRVLLRHGSRRP